MAITITDYVKSDPKVKAARKKLDSVKDKLESAKNALAKSGSASAQTKAELKANVESLQNEYNRINSDFISVENAAKDYFKKNYKTISQESNRETLVQLKKALSQAKDAGTVASIKADIAALEKQISSPEEYKEPENIKVKTDGKTVKDDSKKVSDVDRINAALAAEAETKKATEYISSLNDSERLIWAKSLKDAGYDVLETGTLNRGLIEAYQSALSDTQAENTFYKDTKNFKPYSLTDYLAYRTGLVNIGKGGAGGVDTTFDITTLTDVDAAAYVENVLQSELKRKPTTEEINALIPALKAYARATPVKTTATDTTRTRTSGPNPIDWLTQVIRGQQELVGFNLKNKKEAVKAKSAELAIKKLSKEVEQKGLNTLANFSENIRNTINANGLGKVINQFQIDEWAKRLQNGESKDTVDREIRNIAKIGMPDTVKSLIDSGINLDTIYSPYRKAMATILELNPETISLDDSLLRRAIGPNGEMPIYEFEKALRQDPRWERTDNARQEVSTAALRVLQDFGFQG